MANRIEQAYRIARDQYTKTGVNVERCLATLKKIQLSLNCWQGDDVTGFEGLDALLSGGIGATGNYPGRARSAADLRRDIEQAMGLIGERLGLGGITVPRAVFWLCHRGGVQSRLRPRNPDHRSRRNDQPGDGKSRGNSFGSAPSVGY